MLPCSTACGAPSSGIRNTAFQLELQGHVANARALGLSILSALTSVPQPAAQGGYYFYLDLTELQRRAEISGRELDADEVVNALLMEAGVATVSGTAFGDPPASDSPTASTSNF